MSKKNPDGHTVALEKFINGSTWRVVEDGDVLRSETTGKAIKFDRQAATFSADLQAFLETEAKAGTIPQRDVSIWHLWLIDDGRASAATLMRGESTRARKAPNLYHWQNYDFAGF